MGLYTLYRDVEKDKKSKWEGYDEILNICNLIPLFVIVII